ncbi:cupin domain-containing protein [Sphingobacterium sp.]|uniref:cupin domain-containing protein n=1 Tax=Sphingobacterium sp. TaxID=341027 RepID=UPI002590BF22|nr:cupin domain-containing protein [Sphingobacterium sp.]WET71827.1 MAG: cupin domain-containing protein [Sphingobacterium sp.]
MYTEQALFDQGYQPAPKEYFTGKAWLKNYILPDRDTPAMVGDVLFEAGTRNHWHTHGCNQILMVKEGVCYYQQEGRPVQRIPAGGVINILPGIKHWHGASPEGVMVHTNILIATDKGIVDWMEPVSDEQYGQ